MAGTGADQKEQVKGSGSNSHSDRNRNQTLEQSEQVEAVEGLTFSDTDSDDDAEDSQTRKQRRESTTSASPSRREDGQPMVHQFTTTKNTSKVPHKKDFDDTNDDWDAIEELTKGSESSSKTPKSPSYDFPGTWTAAYHDSSAALTQVGKASASYASALTQSGIGKASLSIGSAFLSSTGKGASNLAGWAFDRAGVVPNDLPKPMRGWLERKAKRVAEQKLANKGSQMHQPGGEQPGPLFLEDEHEGFMVEAYQLGRGDEVPRNRPVEVEELSERWGWRRAAVSYAPPPPHMRGEDE